jgi:hypothetical protein
VAAFLTAQDSLARLLLVLSLVLLLRLGCVVLLLYHADDPAWQWCVRCIEAPCTRLTSVRQRLSPPTAPQCPAWQWCAHASVPRVCAAALTPRISGPPLPHPPG